MPSFLSLPNQPATVLNGAPVRIEIPWLATPYPSLKGSRAQTQPLAASPRAGPPKQTSPH
jgi:hypothetical protein